MLHEDVHAGSSREVLQEGLAAADEGLMLVNPTQETMRNLVYAFEDDATASPVRLFADRQPLKDMVDDFLVASITADLVAAETLAIRTLQTVPRNSLLLTDECIISLVDGGETAAGLTTTDNSFVTATYEHYGERWKRADEFSLRTPPLSHIRETLEAEISPDALADFDRTLETLNTARGNGDGLDEVTISLLVAANNGELLYDISRWGEDIGLASKATFSRTKNRLEDTGLIDTEKVPIDVGRPRLRLMLGDSPLREAAIEEVVERAESTLS